MPNKPEVYENTVPKRNTQVITIVINQGSADAPYQMMEGKSALPGGDAGYNALKHFFEDICYDVERIEIKDAE